MVYEVKEITPAINSLFEGWQETLIYSCLEQVMGRIFVTDLENPKSAMAYVGCFSFYAGEPDEELIKNTIDSFMIMTPGNEEWAKLIEKCFSDSKKVIRYAIKKDTKFDVDKLKKIVSELPSEYELKRIDEHLYDVCLNNPLCSDFVSSFDNVEHYMKYGRGFVIMKDGEIVSGASSYTAYKEGIEIEVDTHPDFRRKHLALTVCAALILSCIEDGLYPSWDAQNMNSVKMSEMLGYEFNHEYVAYEVCS